MFEQIKLSYASDALEPVIDAATIETHYGKHHAAYYIDQASERILKTCCGSA